MENMSFLKWGRSLKFEEDHYHVLYNKLLVLNHGFRMPTQLLEKLSNHFEPKPNHFARKNLFLPCEGSATCFGGGAAGWFGLSVNKEKKKII